MKRTGDRREIQNQTSIFGGMMVAAGHVVVVAAVVAAVVVAAAVGVAAAAAVQEDLEIVGVIQRVDLAGCTYEILLRVGLGRMEVTGQWQEGKTAEALNNWTSVRF